MENDRVKDFAARAESRSLSDVTEAIEDLRKAVQRIQVVIKPQISPQETTVIIEFPTSILLLMMAAPYFVFIGIYIAFKFLPKLAIMIQ